MSHAEPCPECNGMPDESDDMTGCGTCWGDGWVVVEDDEDDDDDSW